MEYELGKSYDEINMGDKASFSKTITETDIALFAAITGDFNPMHMNEEFAQMYRKRYNRKSGVYVAFPWVVLALWAAGFVVLLSRWQP